MPTSAVMHDPILYQLSETKLERIFEALKPFTTVGCVLFISSLIYFQESLLPDWTNSQRFRLSAATTAPFALIAAWIGYRYRFHGLTLTPHSIRLHSDWRGVTIPLADLLAVVGLPGLDLSGGDTIKWKQLLIVTKSESYRPPFESEHLIKFYQAIVAFYPHCLAVPYPAKGILLPPQVSQVWPPFRASMRREIRRHYTWGFLILAAGLVVFSILLLYEGIEGLTASGPPCLMSLLHGSSLISTGSKLSRTVAALRKRMF